MARIKLVSDEEATGRLAECYAAARGRAGRVYEIVRTMSPNPAILEGSMALYLAALKGPSPLSRAQREMLATVVSRANDCHY